MRRMALALLVTMISAACQGGGAPVATTTAAPPGARSTSTATPGAATTASTATPVVALGHDCRAPATPTTASTEGPYFKAGSPQKDSLVTDGMAGTRIRVFAFVLTRACAPVARAKVDLWQADAKGEYDNAGYTLRGHVFTDDRGRSQVDTIVPGPYPGRTPHIHVKIVPPSGAELTTQLYMPDEPRNASDGIFRGELTLRAIAPSFYLFTFILDRP